MLFRQRPDPAIRYEQALAEIAEIHRTDQPVDLGRLEELTLLIEEFEKSVWTEELFESFDAVRLEA